MKKKTTYQNSGVSVNTGDKFVKSIQPYVKKTLTKEVVGSTTSFAALYSIEAKQKKIKKPILVACTDGVGTKIDLGIRTRKVKGLGIDLVAMCVKLYVLGIGSLYNIMKKSFLQKKNCYLWDG